MANTKKYGLFFWLAVTLLTAPSAHGQRISFGTWAGSNIVITPVAANSLDFGVLVKGEPAVSIDIAHATGFEITAPLGFDLTVTMSAPTTLDGPNSKTIPFDLKFAYSNQGLIESVARLNTVEVTTGFNEVTFPIKRSATGLPAPPPTPLDGTNSTRTSAKAYLYIYGSVGPAGGSADAGEYTGTVNITVAYTGI